MITNKTGSPYDEALAMDDPSGSKDVNFILREMLCQKPPIGIIKTLAHHPSVLKLLQGLER